MRNDDKPLSPWRSKLHEVIFEAETPMGKAFDISLLVMIILSVLIVTLDSVKSISEQYIDTIIMIEWALTIIFSIEYMCRIISTKRPLKYIFSFYGLVDLLSIVPTYLGLFLDHKHTSLLVIRVLRLLRVFRVLKLVQFVGEAQILKEALKSSSKKITIFIGTVLSMCVIIGAVMYIVEGEVNPGFNSIPQGVYWAIVTLTTVGYGDVAPVTVLGKFLSSLVMIMGYGVIAVPTGIVTVELANKQTVSTQACPSCSLEGHDNDATYCKYCGAKL